MDQLTRESSVCGPQGRVLGVREVPMGSAPQEATVGFLSL